MPELRFGKKEDIKKRDDFLSYFSEELFQKVRGNFRRMEICEECRFCGLHVIAILKDKDGEDVLVWDTHRSRACIGVILTDASGEFIFE